MAGWPCLFLYNAVLPQGMLTESFILGEYTV